MDLRKLHRQISIWENQMESAKALGNRKNLVDKYRTLIVDAQVALIESDEERMKEIKKNGKKRGQV